MRSSTQTLRGTTSGQVQQRKIFFCRSPSWESPRYFTSPGRGAERPGSIQSQLGVGRVPTRCTGTAAVENKELTTSKS